MAWNKVKYLASDSWVVPAGVKEVILLGMGGGGGGGGGSRSNDSAAAESQTGGGGGAGATPVWTRVSGLTPGASITVTVGPGGASGAGASSEGNGSAGVSGGVTTFGDTVYFWGGGGGKGGIFTKPGAITNPGDYFVSGGKSCQSVAAFADIEDTIPSRGFGDGGHGSNAYSGITTRPVFTYGRPIAGAGAGGLPYLGGEQGSNGINVGSGPIIYHGGGGGGGGGGGYGGNGALGGAGGNANNSGNGAIGNPGDSAAANSGAGGGGGGASGQGSIGSAAAGAGGVGGSGMLVVYWWS